MTKQELIKALEPFDNDIEVYVEADVWRLAEKHEYKVEQVRKETKFGREKLIFCYL